MARRNGPYNANKVRQGEIILTKPWMRGVFIAGLVLAVLVGLFFSDPSWGGFLS